jgi:hypothetical protein
MIKVARAGVVIGEYPKADIPALVRAKVILPTDDYWTAGMAGWSKVSSLLNSSGQPPALPPKSPATKYGQREPSSNIALWKVLAGVGGAFALLFFFFGEDVESIIRAFNRGEEAAKRSGRQASYTPKVEVQKFAVVGSSQSEGGATLHYYRITGEVKNVGSVSGTPALEIRLRSSSGSLISSKQTFPTMMAVRLAPGETCRLDKRIYSDLPGCTIEVKFIDFPEAPTGR